MGPGTEAARCLSSPFCDAPADRAYYPDSNRAIDSVYMQVSLNKQAHQYTVDKGVIVLSLSACTMRSPPCCVRGCAG